MYNIIYLNHYAMFDSLEGCGILMVLTVRERGNVSDHVKESGTNWAVSPSPKTLVRDSWHDVVLKGYVRALVLGRSVLDECVYVSINQDAATVSSCLRLARICADKSDSTFDLLLKANDVEP